MMKRILKWLLILLLTAAILFGGWFLHRRQQAAGTAATAVQYTPVTISAGSLSREVISTGSLTIPRTESVTAPAAVTIREVTVRAGQQVKAGEALATVDEAALAGALTTVQSELTSVDETLVKLAGSYASQQTLTVPIKGRVKLLYAHAGDRVEDVMAEYGCLYVLSLDGKLCAALPASEETTLGSKLTVTTAAGRTYTGTIEAVDDTTATITFSDQAAEVGDTVTVLVNDAPVVSGACAIHMPLEVSSDASGVITSELLRLNRYCEKKASAYVVSYPEPTREYTDALAQRAALVAQLKALKALGADPVIRSSGEGIINTVAASAGQSAACGDELFTLYVGMPDTMTISVDELDIIHVAEGQSATVSMDAITDKTYNAAVTYLSTLGTSSAGITGYDVTVQLEADEQLKLGMNGTVTIAVGQQENALLVPLSALQNDAQGSYVWLYSPEHTATEEAPGIKTYVNTGLSNEDYAAVTGGLQAGDQVLVVRSAATAEADVGQAVGIQLPGSDTQLPGGERTEGGFSKPSTGTDGGTGGGRTKPGTDGSTGGGRTGTGSGTGGSGRGGSTGGN